MLRNYSWMGHTNFPQISSRSFTPSMVFRMDIMCHLYLYYYLGSLKLSSIVQPCTDNGFNLKPDIVHVDFEESMMKGIRSIFPATNIKYCRFHLGQAWWRKIQNLGLANEYKDSANSEIGKGLTAFFGLAFLPYSDVENSFVEDFMSVAPEHQKCSACADYLTDTYITHESLFPPHLWAEAPSNMKRTNNGPESFHCQVTHLYMYFWRLFLTNRLLLTSK